MSNHSVIYYIFGCMLCAPSGLEGAGQRADSCKSLPLLNKKLSASAVSHRLPPGRLNQISPGLTFKAIGDTALDLFEHFSPDQHHFVTLGRSPFAVSALMNQIKPEAATDVALSYFETVNAGAPALSPEAMKLPTGPYHRGTRTRIHIDEAAFTSKVQQQNVPGQREAVFRYLSEALPSTEKVGDKALVLVDVVDSAASLSDFCADVVAYLQDSGRPLRVKVAALLLGSDYQDAEVIGMIRARLPSSVRDKIEIVAIKTSSELARLFHDEALKEFAPYGPFDTERLRNAQPPYSHQNRSSNERFNRALREDFRTQLRADDGFRRRVQRFAAPRGSKPSASTK